MAQKSFWSFLKFWGNDNNKKKVKQEDAAKEMQKPGNKSTMKSKKGNHKVPYQKKQRGAKQGMKLKTQKEVVKPQPEEKFKTQEDRKEGSWLYSKRKAKNKKKKKNEVGEGKVQAKSQLYKEEQVSSPAAMVTMKQEEEQEEEVRTREEDFKEEEKVVNGQERMALRNRRRSTPRRMTLRKRKKLTPPRMTLRNRKKLTSERMTLRNGKKRLTS